MFFWRKRGREQKRKAEKGVSTLVKALEENLNRFQNEVLKDDDFIIYRRFSTPEPAHFTCALIYADNMVEHCFLSDSVIRPLMRHPLPKLKGRDLIKYISHHVIYGHDVDVDDRVNNLAQEIVSGAAVVLVDGCSAAIIVDAQGWEKRAVSEPVSESVVRGPRVGFTEDVGAGAALLRRKLKSPGLKMKCLEVGERTKTKVVLAYLEDVADPGLVAEVRGRIEQIKIDGILESGYIEELIGDSVKTTLPTVGNTERPDVVAAKLLEGRVAVLVDGTPFALTMPYLFMEAFQANEDYFKHWIGASFSRFLRYLSFFLTTSIPALYLSLITFHPRLIPTELVLSISASQKDVPFPAAVEVVVLGLMFEILREGGVRLPQPIGQSISIVGAIVLGEAAVMAHLVSAPMIIVIAITGISGFVIPTLHNTTVFLRLFFVLLASVLGLYGFLLGFIALLIHLSSLHSFGIPYLTSLSSFTSQDFKDTLIRGPWWRMFWRPRRIGAGDRVRLRGTQL
ncbi:MAG: spore germination protein [Firmicutes bacterium]|nr:spore germination protein [Bacillota bacterium]